MVSFGINKSTSWENNARRSAEYRALIGGKHFPTNLSFKETKA